MYCQLCVVRDVHLIRMSFVWPMYGCRFFYVQNLTAHNSIKQDAKERGGRRKERSERKGMGAPAIRAGIFVFGPPFS